MWKFWLVMDEHVEMLRKRIDLYRRRLMEGVETKLARVYLADIASMEIELARLERDAADHRPAKFR